MGYLQPNRRTDQPEAVNIAAAATLTKFQTYVRVETADGAFTLTLPHVTDAAGVIICITKIDSSANACTLADDGGAEDWSNLTIDAINDSVVLLSDGFKWHTLSNEIA